MLGSNRLEVMGRGEKIHRRRRGIGVRCERMISHGDIQELTQGTMGFSLIRSDSLSLGPFSVSRDQSHRHDPQKGPWITGSRDNHVDISFPLTSRSTSTPPSIPYYQRRLARFRG
jgi:hypothetical protein